MNRRKFIASSAHALAAPLCALAQQKRPTIAVLLVDTAKPSQWLHARWFAPERLRRGSQSILDDRTVPNYEALGEQAATLARGNVDVIGALGATALLAVTKVTRTTPIVMVAGIDPVAAGLATSITRPGGNVTGINLFASELQAKRFELLKELVPNLTRVGVLGAADSSETATRMKETETAARSLKLSMHAVQVGSAHKLGEAFAELARAGAAADGEGNQ